MSEEPIKYEPGDHERKRLEEALAGEKLIKETFDELTNNVKYKEFFEQYHPGSVSEFIKEYANQKAQWARFGGMYIKLEEDRAVQFREDAEQYLWLVNQKKLFNIQCLWRAGKIELDGVESIYEFTWHWEMDTKRCPFLPPITHEEFDVLKKAIVSENGFGMGPTYKGDDFFAQMSFKWQGYDEFKKYYNAHGESPFPDWYNFYDMYMGTGNLFLLEDLRGPKEIRYMMIGHDYIYPEQKFLENHPEVELPFEVLADKAKQTPVQVPAPAAPIESRPFLQNNDDTVLEFMNRFDEAEELIDYAGYCIDALRESYEEHYDIEGIVDFLLHAEDVIPMKASWNWEEGLHDAMYEYKHKKELEVLDDVFEDYLMRKENNIPLDLNNEYLTYAEMGKGFAVNWKAKVLAGRKVCGEPEDFNF